jgi:hypothetical protein
MEASEASRWQRWIERNVQRHTRVDELPDEFIAYLGSHSPRRSQVLLHLVVWLMAGQYGRRVYEMGGEEVAKRADQVKYAIAFESLRRQGIVDRYPGMGDRLSRFVSARPPSGILHICGSGPKRKRLAASLSARQRQWLRKQLDWLREAKGRESSA